MPSSSSLVEAPAPKNWDVDPVKLEVLPPEALDRDETGKFRTCVATLFPAFATLVAWPGIHATQRSDFIERLNRRRAAKGEPKLGEDEESSIWDSAVDLIIQRDCIQIRTDPDKIGLAFDADELLQQAVQTHLIRFLTVGHRAVRIAVKRRGECWRITPRPISTQAMKRSIRNSRMGINGEKIYYHSPSTGTRWLTCESFAGMADLSDKELALHLIEIQHYSRCMNALKNPEVDFFIAGRTIWEPLQRKDFSVADAMELRSLHSALAQQFRSLVPTDLRHDDLDAPRWCEKMISVLRPLAEGMVRGNELIDLAPEFYMHVQWLPGGCIEDGELTFDSVFDDPSSTTQDEFWVPIDEKARCLIFNYVRDYGDLEYINVGRIDEPLTLGRPRRGRREVYVVQMKQRSYAHEIVKIIRLQKWDVSRHLDDKKDLLHAMTQSEEYTEYILDRRLGCRRLGMHLPSPLTTSRISEIYQGKQLRLHGTPIWTPYFERAYIRGMATDKIPKSRFSRAGYAIQFARLLGRAAAPNIIVGRCDDDGHPFFDDGDEVVIENEHGLPDKLVVTHHTGAFSDYEGDLARVAQAYADPVNSRWELVPLPREFADAYLASFVESLIELKEEYRRHPRAFDPLFLLRDRHKHGSIADRWECVLARLRRLDPHALADEIRAHFPASAQGEAISRRPC